MILNEDYVISPKADFILNKGVFVGTKSYLFLFPFEQYRSIINTTRIPTAKGKTLEEIVVTELSNCTITEIEFYNIINSLKYDLMDIQIYPIDEFEKFKISANVFGSGIIIKKKGNKKNTPLSWGLGRNYRKQIKAFYKHQEKRNLNFILN